MRTFGKMVLACGLVALLVAPAQAQRPGGGRGFGGGFGGGGGTSSSSEISSWVSANFTSQTVGGVTVYDLTSAST